MFQNDGNSKVAELQRARQPAISCTYFFHTDTYTRHIHTPCPDTQAALHLQNIDFRVRAQASFHETSRDGIPAQKLHQTRTIHTSQRCARLARESPLYLRLRCKPTRQEHSVAWPLSKILCKRMPSEIVTHTVVAVKVQQCRHTVSAVSLPVVSVVSCCSLCPPAGGSNSCNCSNGSVSRHPPPSGTSAVVGNAWPSEKCSSKSENT